MRKLLARIPVAASILLVIGVVFAPDIAHAQGVAGWLGFGFDALYGTIGKVIWWTLVPLTSFVLNLVGQLIDIALSFSLTSEFYASEGITLGWGIIRDLCNIIFIFILVFTGIRTILGLDTSETRRVVISVIIGAVLINFSLFLTKAAIDVSNIFTAWITEGIKVLGGGYGVSDSSISVLGMQKLAAAQGSITDIKNWSLTTFASGIALVTLNCIAIYVFFKVAFLMLGRLVSFILLLIMSPIGFVGHLVPRLDVYAKDWRDELTKACLMAPMFLLMLYITLFLATKFDTVLSEFNVAGSTNSLVSGGFGIPQYALFAIIAMMMLKSLKVAEDYTGAIAGQVGGIIKSGMGVALGGVTAGAGLIGRQSFGRAALGITQDKERMALLQSQAAQKGVAGVWARTKLGAVNKAATSSFDARATSIGGTALGALDPKLSVAGIKLDASKVGKTEAGGFKAGIEESVKAEKEWAEKNLGKGKVGEANRIAYAQNLGARKWYMGGGVVTKKAGEDISDAAYKAYTKAEKEGAEKDAQKIKNLIIDNQIATDTLKGALTQNDPAVINKSVDVASAKIDDFMKKRKKDASGERTKLTWKANQMDKEIDERIERGDYDGANELRGSDEYGLVIGARRDADESEKTSAEKMGELTERDYNEAVKGYKKKVVDTEHEVTAAKKILSEAQSLEKIVEKKEKIDDAIKHINDKIVGKEGQWDGKTQKYKEGKEASGLKLELDENKRKAQAKKDESRVIGAESGGAPAPKDEDEGENDNK